MKKPLTPKQQLEAFLDRYPPGIAKLARAAIARIRKVTPGAFELVYVYENRKSLVISFSPTEHGSEGIFSIATLPHQVSMYFQLGKGLPDPTRRLRGSGKAVRYAEIEGLEFFKAPDILKLIAVTKKNAKVPFQPKRKRTLIIKSGSA